MILRGLAMVAVLLAMAQASRPVVGQAGGQAPGGQSMDRAGASGQAPSLPASPVIAPGTQAPNTNAEDYRQPRVFVAVPAPQAAPQPAPLTLRERITWGANLVLVILGYVGIMIALSTLRKIERQTRYAEAAAEAASGAAQAALLHAQSIVRSERPWILINVEPSVDIKNKFTVVATNRGRSPAKIVAIADQTAIVVDEAHLARRPEFKSPESDAASDAAFFPIILLPGESTVIKSFSRDDAIGICESEEQFRRVENWEEKVFLYGKIIYNDLIAPEERQTHETGWCCWYIHGRQKSGLVMAGSPEYNLHT